MKQSRKLTVLFLVMLLLSFGFSGVKPVHVKAASQKKWDTLLKKYSRNTNTDRLIFVQYVWDMIIRAFL